MHKYFFEIPIYRCTLDDYSTKIESKKNKFIASYNIHNDAETAKYLEIDFLKRIFRTWKFNDIIGWICLYNHKFHIKGDLYFVDSKKITRSLTKKRFIRRGKIFELRVSKKMNSMDIYEQTLYKLKKYMSERYSKHFLDLNIFEQIGPHLDWRKLVD